MRIATTRYRPGIPSPRGRAVAIGVMAVMGVYGFTTGLQKAVAVQRGAVTATTRGDDDVRLASAVGPTPSLVYALTDRPPAAPQVVRRPAPRLPEPVIPAEPVPVELAVVSAPTLAPVLAEAPSIAPNAAAAAADVSAVSPAPLAPAPLVSAPRP